MFWDKTDFQEKYYLAIAKIGNFEKDLKFLDVDFHQPIWKPLSQKKWLFAIDLLSEVIQAVFGALTPLMLGYIIYQKDVDLLFVFGLSYVVLELINCWMLRNRALYQLELENSVSYFLVTFINLSSNVRRVGVMIRDFTEKYAEIKDLWTFIQGFGIQSFPVLEEEN